jgi:hypothetical protein
MATEEASSTGADELAPARELIIEIWPRGYDQWTGTREQLEAEGLIPQGFEWPVRFSHAGWAVGPFDLMLSRQRPEGHKGSKSTWADVDYWWLRRTLVEHRGTGFAAAILYRKQQEFRRAGEAQPRTRCRKRLCRAIDDEAFQRFKCSIFPNASAQQSSDPQRHRADRPASAEPHR